MNSALSGDHLTGADPLPELDSHNANQETRARKLALALLTACGTDTGKDTTDDGPEPVASADEILKVVDKGFAVYRSGSSDTKVVSYAEFSVVLPGQRIGAGGTDRYEGETIPKDMDVTVTLIASLDTMDGERHLKAPGSYAELGTGAPVECYADPNVGKVIVRKPVWQDV